MEQPCRRRNDLFAASDIDGSCSKADATDLPEFLRQGESP